jgi:hypothetical protein
MFKIHGKNKSVTETSLSSKRLAKGEKAILKKKKTNQVTLGKMQVFFTKTKSLSCLASFLNFVAF